jgi:nicotinamidase-related amidase
MGLPIPPHFEPAACARLYRVPYAERAAEARVWAAAHGVQPASEDARRVGLLLVDVQNTFCLPGFELFVGGRSGTGAVDDNARLCAFLYRNLDLVTEVVATLDTHGPHQVFHPVFWVDAQGDHPPAHTVVRAEDVASGRLRIDPRLAAVIPSLAADPASYALHYVRSLEQGGKYPLTLWPYHAMLGGVGHALVSAVEEAVFFHSLARTSPARFEIKGRHPLTENYSVLRPEVDAGPDGRSLVGRNAALVDHLLAFDVLVVAGQARSHCVAWTVADLLAEIVSRDEELARRVVLLDDCSSAVCVPGVVDFTEAAEEAYARFAAAGMRRVAAAEARDILREA